MTIVLDGNQEICRIYRQFDGYPSAHGVELADICNRLIVSGFGGPIRTHGRTFQKTAQANGMGCLAAQIVAALKKGIGGIYLEPTGGEISDWCEYVYIVTGGEGAIPTITCSTQTGPWPFNTVDEARHVFTLRADQVAEWVKKNENVEA